MYLGREGGKIPGKAGPAVTQEEFRQARSILR